MVVRILTGLALVAFASLLAAAEFADFYPENRQAYFIGLVITLILGRYLRGEETLFYRNESKWDYGLKIVVIGLIAVVFTLRFFK